MYSIYSIIYGKVLTDAEIKEIDKKLEEKGELIIQDWIENYGGNPYSGAGDTDPMYIGVPLATIRPMNHGDLLSSIRITPSKEEIKRVKEIQKDIEHIFNFDPKVYICHSTS